MTPDQALTLLIVTVAVALLPGVSRRLRLPAPVMEILFGILLARGSSHFDFSGAWLQLLAHLGFLLLMFHSGMEIDFGMLLRQSRREIGLQFLVFFVTLALSFLCALWLARGVFMTLVLATTSLGLVMPALKEVGAQKTPLGQTLLFAASLADFLSLLAITFFVMWSQFGLTWRLASPLLLFVAFVLLLWLGRLWVWWNPEKAGKLLSNEDPLEMGVRLSLALLFLFVAVSELVHLEPVLGAFLGGCVLSFAFREKEQLESKISALGFGFLIPIFFIHVGIGLDLSNLLSWQQIFFSIKLFILAMLVKVLPSLLFTLKGIPLKTALQAGVLLSARLSLIVAAATIGVEQGFIQQEVKDAAVLLALLTCLSGTTLFKFFSSRGTMAQSREDA